MRKFIFRVWDKRNKKMSEPFTFGYTSVDFNNYSSSVLDIEDNNLYVVMQYTGLKDKNGKEIYEGDIVENWCVGVIKFGVYDNGERYDDAEVGNGFYFDYGENVSHFYNADDSEIIGNIYENRELLNATK